MSHWADLFTAATYGNRERVEVLLDSGESANSQNAVSVTQLAIVLIFGPPVGTHTSHARKSS
jgi:hypothetical protein